MRKSGIGFAPVASVTWAVALMLAKRPRCRACDSATSAACARPRVLSAHVTSEHLGVEGVMDEWLRAVAWYLGRQEKRCILQSASREMGLYHQACTITLVLWVCKMGYLTVIVSEH